MHVLGAKGNSRVGEDGRNVGQPQERWAHNNFWTCSGTTGKRDSIPRGIFTRGRSATAVGEFTPGGSSTPVGTFTPGGSSTPVGTFTRGGGSTPVGVST